MQSLSVWTKIYFAFSKLRKNTALECKVHKKQWNLSLDCGFIKTTSLLILANAAFRNIGFLTYLAVSGLLPIIIVENINSVLYEKGFAIKNKQTCYGEVRFKTQI